MDGLHISRKRPWQSDLGEDSVPKRRKQFCHDERDLIPLDVPLNAEEMSGLIESFF